MEVDMDMNEDVVTPTPVQQMPQIPVTTQQIVPNHTVYIRNVNYKLPVNTVKIELYNQFARFGKILDIVVGEKRYALKGQAWIIFDQIEEAIKAVTQMNGKVVLNRPVTVTFAKTESDLILKREGRFTYVKRTFVSYAEKMAKEEKEGEGGRAAASRLYNYPPNNKLLLFDLPSDISQEMLLPIVKPYSGFRELSIVPGGRGIAFVDFDSVRNAGICLSAIKNITLPRGERIFAAYAK